MAPIQLSLKLRITLIVNIFLLLIMVVSTSLTIQDTRRNVHDLSVREFEIFRSLAEGLNIEAIATILNISTKTVSNYQTAIKKKLNINTPIELIRYAIKFGVIKN